MDQYLRLFEQAIERQAEHIGAEKAREQARKAGLTVSADGDIVCCDENPLVVLLRLIRHFTQEGNLAALDACTPLITKLTEIPAEIEENTY